MVCHLLSPTSIPVFWFVYLFLLYCLFVYFCLFFVEVVCDKCCNRTWAPGFRLSRRIILTSKYEYFCWTNFLIFAFIVLSPVHLDHGPYLTLFLVYLSFPIPSWPRYTQCLTNDHTVDTLEYSHACVVCRME